MLINQSEDKSSTTHIDTDALKKDIKDQFKSSRSLWTSGSKFFRHYSKGPSQLSSPHSSMEKIVFDGKHASISNHVSVSNDVESTQTKSLVNTRLPPVSEIINSQIKNFNEDVHQVVIELTKYAQSLEHLVRTKNKEIQRLEYLNKYMVLGQQKRDDVMSHTLEENRRLKEMLHQAGRPITLNKNRSIDTATATPLNMTTTPITIKRGSIQTFPRQNIMNKHTDAWNNTLNHTTQQTAVNPIVAGRKSLIHELKSESFLKMSNYWHYKSNRLMPLSIDEQDAIAAFLENESMKFLRNLTKDEEHFIEKIKQFDNTMLISLFDAIHYVLKENENLMQLCFKLKKITKAANTMTSSLVLTDAMERIVEETCECLSCDRATVFMLDAQNGELWSKVAKGSGTIRIPWNKGIVGHVATTGETLNIKNAYSDSRFNKEIDLKTNYKTNTILCVPIIDESRHVTGVIQAINKHGGLFTSDDEALLFILASLAGVVLRNSISHDQEKLFQNNLRAILRIGIYLHSIFGLPKLISQAEKKLCDIINTDKSKIYLYDKTSGQVIWFNKNGEKNYLDANFGIVGQVIKQKEYEIVPNAYTHNLYNGKIDIETSMPLVCWPIKHSNNEDQIIRIFQVVHPRAIQGLTTIKKVFLNPSEHETLDFFSKQLAQAIINNHDGRQGSSNSVNQ